MKIALALFSANYLLKFTGVNAFKLKKGYPKQNIPFTDKS